MSEKSEPKSDQPANITPPILYDIVVEGHGYTHRIDWGACKDWAKRYRVDLDQAWRISLVPKQIGGLYPIVSAELGEDRRWIVFSRVFGRDNQVERIRLYAIGWQSTIRGKNVKTISWIYPNGTMEMADEPTYWAQFLDLARGQGGQA